MWNITPTDVEFAKEELKGRRAAIQARYEDEIQKLTAELDDIEAFERVAAAFAQRHKQEEASAPVEPNPKAPLEALTTAEDVTVARNESQHPDGPLADKRGEMDILPGKAVPIAADASVAQKVPSRWRLRAADQSA